MSFRKIIQGVLIVASVAALVASPLLVLGLWNRSEDARIVEETAPTVTAFFRATTSGDIAAATSLVSPRLAASLPARIEREPASFRVKEISEFGPVEIYHHHPFVIRARLTLANGAAKWGRFRIYFDERGWVIDAFQLGDALPSTPTQSGSDE